MSTVINFTAYQKGTTSKGLEFNIAIERKAIVADVDNFNMVYGGILQSLFDFESLATLTGRKIFRYTAPLFLRFQFKGEVVDTASLEPELLKAMKINSRKEGRKKFAKNTWAMLIDRTLEREPVSYVAEVQDIVPVRLLGTVRVLQAQIEDGTRFTNKPHTNNITGKNKTEKKAKNTRKKALLATAEKAIDNVLNAE